MARQGRGIVLSHRFGAPIRYPTGGGGGPTVYATDDADRTIASGSGWGTTSDGNFTYSIVSSGTAMGVDGSRLFYTNTGATSKLATIAVAQQDVDFVFTFRIANIPSTGAYSIWAIGRMVDSSNYYRLLLQIAITTGALSVRTGKFVAAAAVNIGALTSAGFNVAANTDYTCRVQFDGVSPTTLRMRVWDTSGSEPGTWLVEDTDSEAVLQISTGSYGLRMLPGAAADLTTVSFDNLTWKSTATGGGPVLYTVNLTGGITPSGTIVRVTQKVFSGAASPTGAVSKTAMLREAGSITPTGRTIITPRVFKVGGATPSGALVRQAQKRLAGAATPTGSLARTAQLRVAGSSSPTGSLVRQAQLRLAGSITPTGTVARTITRFVQLAGSISPTGAIVKQARKVATGAVTPTGSIARLAIRVLAAAVTPTGALVRLVTKRVSGTVTPTGSLSTSTTRFVQLAGSIAPVGAVIRQAQKRLAGTITPTGTVGRRTTRVVGGGVTPTGTVVRRAARVLGGTATPSGTVARTIYRRLAGAIAPAGSLVATFVSGTVTLVVGGLPPRLASGVRSVVRGIATAGRPSEGSASGGPPRGSGSTPRPRSE